VNGCSADWRYPAGNDAITNALEDMFSRLSLKDGKPWKVVDTHLLILASR
jgi:hypothetical protein